MDFKSHDICANCRKIYNNHSPRNDYCPSDEILAGFDRSKHFVLFDPFNIRGSAQKALEKEYKEKLIVL